MPHVNMPHVYARHDSDILQAFEIDTRKLSWPPEDDEIGG